jgi:hypothetical protein
MMLTLSMHTHTSRLLHTDVTLAGLAGGMAVHEAYTLKH